MQHREADILIIGAGLAGLAAAECLAKSGLRSVVLEARDRIGGRAFTRHDPMAQRPVELGPEWFDTHGDLRRLLLETGHPMREAQGEFLKRGAGGGQEEDEDFAPLLKALGELRGPDRSLIEALEALPVSLRDPRSEQALLDYVRGFHAADPMQLSLHWLMQVERTQSADASQLRSVHGVSAVAEQLLAQCGDRCTVHPEHVVEQVRWSKGRVQVDGLVQGRPFRFLAPKALITLPLAVLQADPSEHGAVVFDPPLTDKHEALDRLAMGRVMKVILVFREDPCADDPQLNDALFLQDLQQPFPTWWNARPDAAPVWSGWAGGPLAERTSALHGDALRDAALRSFAHAAGLSFDAVSAALADWYHHDWSRDPFTRGGYSYVKPGGLHAHRVLAEPLEGTLHFAGEATCGDGYNATMEGAVRSGRRAARELMQGSGKEPT